MRERLTVYDIGERIVGFVTGIPLSRNFEPLEICGSHLETRVGRIIDFRHLRELKNYIPMRLFMKQ